MKRFAMLKFMVISLTMLLALQVTGGGATARTLEITEARQLAVEFNRQYLSALEDVNKSRADIKSAWSGALPSLDLVGNYTHSFEIPTVFFTTEDDQGMTETVQLQTGFAHNFNTALVLRQSIWQGGRVFTALSIAKDYEKYSQAGADQVKAAIIYQAEVLFYQAILTRANLASLQQSLEAARLNLEVVEKQHSQGMVSDFELLRARVEEANLVPQVLQAESDVRLAGKQVKSFLGLELDAEIELVASDQDTALIDLLPLDSMLSLALENRPEMSRARYFTEMSHKAIRVARADYYPSLAAEARFDWSAQSDNFTTTDNNSKSWTAGLNLSFPLFNGGRTRAEVTQAKADYRKSQLQLRQVQDDIKLDVEAAYDRVIQAKKALDAQSNTIAQAEEGLRIANVRYESGVGTQLEVLSAQAALTQARELLARATFQFRQAKAGLKLATTMNLDDLN